MADVENLRPYCWRIVCYGIRVLGDLATILVRSTQGLRSSRVLEGIEGSSKRSPVSWFFREPVWVVAAVKPDVPGRGGYLGVRRNGLSKQWLIGVAKPIPQFSEHVEDGLLAPACVRPVRNQAKSQKQRNKSNRYARLLLSFLREWAKLQKQRPDPSSLRQRIDTFLELALIVGSGVPFVRKSPKELCGGSGACGRTSWCGFILGADRQHSGGPGHPSAQSLRSGAR